MAKNKMYMNAIATYQPPKLPDNNPDGPSKLPDYNLEGARNMKGKIAFSDWVAQGESANIGDVNVETANGISSSQGQNKGQRGNWGGCVDGYWNKDGEWVGGNLTGM